MLWASFHKTERDALKVFQLGIVAPAMISGIVAGNEAASLREPGGVFYEQVPEDASSALPSSTMISATFNVADNRGALRKKVADSFEGWKVPGKVKGAFTKEKVVNKKGKEKFSKKKGKEKVVKKKEGFLKSFKSGLLGRPVSRTIGCRTNPVSAIIPYKASVKVSENSSTCSIVVGGQNSRGKETVVECKRFNARIRARGTISVNESSSGCEFYVAERDK